ncbi:MAG TPA: amidohydrolase family protein [Pyrinomonadaceae bacterium]|nr:amidohydrolase family protein [Pyrinomonadaceae bacterium]
MLRRFIALSLFLSFVLPAHGQQPTPTPVPADKRAEQLEEAQRKAEADKRADKWDVEGDHGPTTKVEFDTDEGTWMSCDVSPDGRRIVFDLLGDIYHMSIDGGRAELLSGGVSWESQPRYSPDGKSIVFTSDRDGGDNIWLMDADGRNRRQLTKETLRLVNSPAWMPDSQYVVVRKHFVDQRSLGAGEIWMYHTGGGGTGVQLTEKTSWTANVGEPVVDPKKRFIYFVNSGDFDYNKNVYDSIYWIERYDTARGRRGVFVRGAGGSVRPQVSPDGKLLAFIRRDRLNTVLYLREIESGREWPIYDKLTRDQQETWAVFGTYPGYGWTPDGKSIVITANGKFVRVNVETKGATPVPFSARVSQRVSDAVRFPQKVFTERERTHLHRWAKRSGDRVIYSALGKIYVKAGDGEPRRLLNSNQLEYSPNFSPDGRRITFVTWSDAEKGAVWIADADGANARKITDKPDQYANPAFSPDGRKLAYLKGRGNVNHEEELISESAFEIHYWDGEASRYVMDLQSRGANARMPILSFDPAGERIFFLESPPPVPAPPPGQPAQIFSALSSVKISGDDYKRHFEAKFATEIIPSPDHNWVFFKELHKLYLAPFPQTGKTLRMNSTETILPVKSITKNSGDWLTWSPDSKSVQWTLGENFYEQPVAEINRQLAKDEKPAEPKATRIGFEFESARPRGTVALTNARIITMKGDEVIERGTILVEDNRIKAVGARVQIPANARKIDMTGKTITPGLVDVHAHMGYNTLDIIPEKQWPYWANLAYGVTTTHDPSAATQSVFAQSEMVKAGLMVGPRIFSTGYPVYGAESPEKAPVNNLEDARGHLARLKAVGAFSVKSYNQPRRNQRQQIIQAARELKMMVLPEGGSTYFYNMTHILDGHTGIEHAIPIAPLYKDAVTLFAKSRSGYTPTLVVGYGGVWGENYWYQKTNVWENEKLLRFTPRSTIDPRSRRRTMTPEDDFYHLELAKTVRDVVRAGGRAQLGAHGQLQGLGSHWELWMLQQGGLTPLETLRAATLSGAQYLGLDGEVGSIETGKLADLMITDRNPLDNIQNSETISFVMMNGTLYDTRNMDEVYPQSRPRGKFFWER